MFSQIISAAQNGCLYLYTNHGLQVSWAFSFFINRLVTKTSEESYRQSAVIAAALGTVALADVILRDNEYVSTNAVTYGTMVASYTFPLARQYLDQQITNIDLCDGEWLKIFKPLPILWGISSGIIVGSIVNQGYVKQSIAPAVTGYVNYNINGGAAQSISISVIDEVFIHYNLTNKHYLSALSVSFAISNYFLPKNPYAIFMSSVLSVVAAQHEEEIVEFFLPIKSTKETYQLLLESTNNNSLVVDRLLETSLVVTANIELSSGVLFLQVLNLDNQWLSLLKEACGNKEKFPDFLRFSIKTVSFNMARIIGHGLPSAPVSNYASTVTKKFFKDQFFENKIYQQGNFVVLSGKNFTAETYSKDISIIFNTHIDIFQNIFYYLPSVMRLASFGDKLLLVPAIAMVDGMFVCGLNVLQKGIHSLKDEQMEVFNVIGIKEKHDIKNANLLVHNQALQYMQSQWKLHINNADKFRFHGLILTNLYNSFYELYWDVVLWGGTPMFVVYLVYKDIIAANEVLESTIKNSISTILIKSKKKLELDVADISIKRLQNFLEALKQQRKLSDLVSVSYNSYSKSLKIVDLTYVRGNDNGNVTVNIPFLNLELGKKYVITGSNGGGKSSFLLLLNLLQKSFDDRSFLNVSGYVTYPSDDVVIVTQKEYCPLYSDLFSWLVYPSTLKASNNTKDNYRHKVNVLLNELAFSSKNLTSLEDEFHAVDKDWCSKLSGGQIKKIQMIQSVFLPDNCPKVLFLDETMGPLDPESKVKMQKKLSEHCKDSLILAVYHYDSLASSKSDTSFFDYNLHFENGTVFERGLSGDVSDGDQEGF